MTETELEGVRIYGKRREIFYSLMNYLEEGDEGRELEWRKDYEEEDESVGNQRDESRRQE